MGHPLTGAIRPTSNRTLSTDSFGIAAHMKGALGERNLNTMGSKPSFHGGPNAVQQPA